MSLDPEIAELLPALNAEFPRVETMAAPQLRAIFRERAARLEQPEPVGKVLDQTVPGPAGDIGVRIYWPAGSSAAPSGPPPLVVFAHGGGFVFCDLDTHDGLCRAMTNGIRAVVVSVDYRLAPESPWPAAAEDVYAATDWATRHAEEFGVDPARVVVAGDSAGGNLAAVTALLARDRGGPRIACQVLLYPVIAADFSTETYRRFATGFYNTATAMRWYWDQYVPDIADRDHRLASPIRARLDNLPPTVVVTAGCDPLSSEGEAYAKALAAVGVTVIHRPYAGAVHGFMSMAELGICRRARTQAWADISDLLSRSLR